MPRGLSILMYHAVVETPLPVPDWCFLDAIAFGRQMETVARTGQACSVSEGVARLAAGRAGIAVTFDDGFHNNYSVAFPILERLRIPATVFINTAFVGTSNTVWFCKVNRAVAATRLKSLAWHGDTYDLSSVESRAVSSARLQARLKEHPHPELLLLAEGLCEALGDNPTAPVATDSPYAILDAGAMRAMSSSGLIEFGGHTHTHAILSRLTTEQQRSEILPSITGLRNLGVRTCDVFAYPNGRPQDYGADAIDILRSAGVRAAVTAVHGMNDEWTMPMELKRFGIGPDTSRAEFEEMLGNAS